MCAVRQPEETLVFGLLTAEQFETNSSQQAVVIGESGNSNQGNKRRPYYLLDPCDAVTRLRKLDEHFRIMTGHNQIRARSDLFHPILGFQI